jgi:hypothetical protein
MATRKKREKEKEERFDMKEYEGRKRGEEPIEFSLNRECHCTAFSEITFPKP